VRPLCPHEEGHRICVDPNPDTNQIQIIIPPPNSTVSTNSLYTFHYSKVCPEEIDQENFFEQCDIAKILDAVVLEGFSGSVFAYGQTGTGKTYTISGPVPDSQQNLKMQKMFGLPTDGIVPRSITYIFNLIDIHPELNFSVQCSYLEIYNEMV
jgi:hypothetical protein